MNVKPLLFSTLLFSWFATLILISSCQDHQQAAATESGKFVISHSSGVLPASTAIQVRLAMSLNERFVNEPIPDGIFSFKPEVKGRTYVEAGRILRFIPDYPFKNGKNYKAFLNLQKLFPDQAKNTKQFEFSFQIVDLDFKQNELAISPYVNSSLTWNQLKGSITTSDMVSNEQLSSWLSANQDGRKLKVSWDKASMPPTYRFLIDSVERGQSPHAVVLTWNTADIGIKKTTVSFDVPPISEFNLMSVSTGDYPEQHFVLTFSDPLNPKQNLDGLVYFQSQIKVALDIEGNVLRVTPDTRLTNDEMLSVSALLENINGQKLGEYIERNVHVEPALPEVKFTGSGSILPGEKQWIVPFEARNITSVKVVIDKIFTSNILQFMQINDLGTDYEMYRVGEQVYEGQFDLTNVPQENTWDYSAYAIDLTKFIKAETGAIYQISLSFTNDDIVYPCTSDYNSPDSDYWSNRNDPCKRAYYYSYTDHFPSKNILASNLGVRVKNNGNSFQVRVNNLITTLPVLDCNISLYGFQQQLLGNAATDVRGLATIAVNENSVPGFLIAEFEGQYAYLKLDDGQALSYSKFNTSGRMRQEGLEAFIYGERGVWRPGDTLFMGLILEDRANRIPKNHPVTIEFSDARNKVVQTKTLNKGTQGLYCFTLSTAENNAPGLYTIRATVGNAIFTKLVRIENIVPNRLKIELTTADTLLTEKNNLVEIKSSWLSGGAASGFEANCEATFKPAKTRFEKYPDFQFDCPSRDFYPETKTVFDGRLDANGKVDFSLEFPANNTAPGMISVNLFTKVLENGGGFSVNQTSRVYSPYSNYVGIKLPEIPKGSDFLEVDTPLVFDLVTVNNLGKPVQGKDLDISVYKLTWSWWYGSDGHSNLASYMSSHYDERVLTKTVSTPSGSGTFTLNLEYPAWGWYYAEVVDNESGHATGIRFYVDWPSYYNRDQRQAPGEITQLSLSPDKTQYQIGDTVNITLDVPENARLLISLESNDTILKSWTLLAKKREALIRFEATNEMTPNIYASVGVLQPYNQAVNDLPVRMYGVANIQVNNPNDLLQPTIQSEESVRPKSDYTITVSEKNGREMTYTLAVVDDGLLDLTNFKTPNPYAYFNAKQALGVRTWDDYDQILGVFGGRILHTLAVGGDGSEENTITGEKKANRFKPVVTFLGPFTLRKGEKAEHKLHMPNYIGSVRCMVVASSAAAYGTAQKSITVKQPLMVLATVPRVLSPDETVYVPVTVFALDEKIQKAKVTLSTNELLNTKKNTATLDFDKSGEQMAWFPVKVSEKQGIATIHVEVQSGKEQASYDVEVQVRNPNPVVYLSEHHLLEAGKEAEFVPPLIGIPKSRSSTMTISGTQPINLESRIQYLNQYPYGCTEQVVSGVFPQLYLDRFLDLNNRQIESISNQVMRAIKQASNRQLNSGGFTYWPGSSVTSDWISSYTGHFLLSAINLGYPVAPQLMESWVSFQTKAANNWTPSPMQNTTVSEASQAYRLYTLAFAQKPALSAMNRMAENPSISEAARTHLSAAYAAIGQMAIAKKLFEGNTVNYNSRLHDFDDRYGSQTRDQAFYLITCMALGEKEKAFTLYKQVAQTLGSARWLSTQSTAFALLSVAEFMGDQSPDMPGKYSYTQGGFKSGNRTIDARMTIDTLNASDDKPVKINNLGEKDIYLTFTGSGIPIASKKVDIENNLSFRLTYYDLRNSIISPEKLPLGKDFYVKVTVTKSKDFDYSEQMALSYKIPAGWEIINTNMYDANASLKSSPSDFTDINDDGVDVFFGLRGGETKVYYLLLHASYAGDYTFPVSTCEAMYNNDVKAALGGGWITVSQPK